MIWSDSYLSTLLTEANLDILEKVKCVYTRTALTIVQGTSVYALPTDFRELIRITWKGKPIDSINEFEAERQFYTSAPSGSEYSQGEPKFYCMKGVKYIRLFPTPSEALANVGDAYGSGISSLCIVSYWGTGDIPDYIGRRVKKAYAMMRAFAKEGKGQNLDAVKYFKAKYDFLLAMFIKINSGIYAAKRSLSIGESRRKDPILPSTFERINYQ